MQTGNTLNVPYVRFEAPERSRTSSNDREFEELLARARTQVAAPKESRAGARPGNPRCSGGADDALSALLCRVWPRLLGYARKLTCDEDSAQDVAQETMVKIITSLRNFRPSHGVSGFMAWVFTIATNVYRDNLRRNSRLVPTADAGTLLARRPRPSLDDQAHDNIQREAVLSVLAVLPEEQRIALVLRTYYGYSYREIGRIMRCPEGTVKSRVHAAVLTVREELTRRGML